MRRDQVDRSVTAQRIGARSSTSHGTVGTNPALRIEHITPHPDIHTKRSTKRSKPRGVGTQQRDSRGYRSDWTRSPFAPRGGWR